MERKLDKELYPDYVYPEHQADHNAPPRESIIKLESVAKWRGVR